MIANHVHDALAQVRQLQSLILQKRKFVGFSGSARLLGGSVAFLGCSIMSFHRESLTVQFVGWGLILFVGLLLNYGALLLWFFQLPGGERTARSIVPAFEAVPALAIGAVLSVALLMKGEVDLLFGCWMCLYGLANTVYRSSLPRSIWLLGIYYMVCGSLFLLWPSASFSHPLWAGAVFLVGEGIGGSIFHRHKTEAMKECGNE